jgi:hypothetical protein
LPMIVPKLSAWSVAFIPCPIVSDVVTRSPTSIAALSASTQQYAVPISPILALGSESSMLTAVLAIDDFPERRQVPVELAVLLRRPPRARFAILRLTAGTNRCRLSR